MPKRWTSFCNYVWSWESYIVLRQPCISHVVMVKCGLCQCSRVFARLGFFRYSEFINMNLYEGELDLDWYAYTGKYLVGGKPTSPSHLCNHPRPYSHPWFWYPHTHNPQNKHNNKKMTAHGIEVVHVVGFEATRPNRDSGKDSTCAELSAAVCPAAIEYLHWHIFWVGWWVIMDLVLFLMDLLFMRSRGAGLRILDLLTLPPYYIWTNIGLWLFPLKIFHPSHP